MAGEHEPSAPLGGSDDRVIAEFLMRITSTYTKNFIYLSRHIYYSQMSGVSEVEFLVNGARIPGGDVRRHDSGCAYMHGVKPVWKAAGIKVDDVVKFELLEGSPAVLRVTRMPPGTEPTFSPKPVARARAPRSEAVPSTVKPRLRSESKTEYLPVTEGSDSDSNSGSDLNLVETSPDHSEASGDDDDDGDELSAMSEDDKGSGGVPFGARGRRRRAAAPGAPEVSVDTAVLLGPPNLHFGTVTAMLPPAEGQEGPLRVQVRGTDPAGRPFTNEMSLEEAQRRADAAAPGGLGGVVVKKFFVDETAKEGADVGDDGSDSEERGRLFSGLAKYLPEKGWYHVTYEDGDCEDMDATELLPLIERPLMSGGWDFFPPGWTGPENPRVKQGSGDEKKPQKRRSRPPGRPRGSGAGGGRPSGAGGRKRGREVDSGDALEMEMEDAGPVVGGAQLKTGRKRRQSGGQAAGSAAPMEADAPGPSEHAAPVPAADEVKDKTVDPPPAKKLKHAKKSGAVPKAPRPAAGGDEPEDPNLWTPCGAGHARGVQAYDRPTKSFRDIGRWIAEGKQTTLPGRFSVDFRHLELDERTPVRGSCAVTGWIGVRGSTPKDAPRGVPLVAPYKLVFYDTACARRTFMSFPIFDTAAEAAAAYDRVALAYYGGATADLNFPVEDSVREAAEAAAKAGKGGKALLVAAVEVLNIAQDLPHEAVGTGVTQEAWDAWEAAMMDDFVYQRRQASKENVRELGGRLAWLLAQVVPEALQPQWRAPGALEKFLVRCRRCVEVGGRLGTGSTDPAAATTLAALIYCAEAHVLSGAALDVLKEGGSRDAAAAAAVTEAARAPEERKKKKKEGGDGDEPVAPRRRGRPSKSAATAVATGDSDAPRLSHPAYGFKDPLPPGLRVAVIGGGVAGLKAAADLQRAGAAVTVLEARHRLGGRIHSHTLAAPGTTATATAAVDLGATFLCGTARGGGAPTNPLVHFMKDFLKLKTVAKYPGGPEATALYGVDSTPLPMVEQLVGESRYSEYLVELMERGGDLEYAQKVARSAAAGGGEVPGDESIGAASEAVLAAMDPPLEDFERAIIDGYASDLYAAPLDSLSLPGSIAFGYDGPHEAVPGGFGQLTAAIAAGKDHKAPQEKQGGPDGRYALRDVRLGWEVREIALEADGKGVRVTAAVVPPDRLTSPQTQEFMPPDELKEVEVDAVVVTLPLGVLKTGAVTFSPPLPPHKAAALDGLAVAPATRVAMLFPTPWWNKHTLAQFLRPLTGDYTFLNAHALGTPNALVAWVRPHAVARIKGLSDAEVVGDVLRVLRGLFPAADVTRPVDFAVARWGSDPYAQGAFTCVPVGGSKAALDALAVPVSGDADADDAAAAAVAAGALVSKVPLRPETRLFFAGEATHRPDPYSVHGAMETGRREARRVAEWWHRHAKAIKGPGPASAGTGETVPMTVDGADKKSEEEEGEVIAID